MNRPQPNDDILEQAALYALGGLTGKEREQFEQLVSEGCATCQALEEFQDVANQLGASAKPVTPPPELRGKLFERIKSQVESSSAKVSTTPIQNESSLSGLTFVTAGPEGWQEVEPGLKLKTLFFDQTQGRMTALARMDAGCHYAVHRHDKPEELYVLEGTCHCGGQLLHPGDYHRAETNTIHYETSTIDGCLMLVIFSPTNEMLDPTPT